MKNILEAPLNEVLIIRQKVMWPDKDINYVKVEGDEKAIHYGIKINDQWISIVSLFYEEDQVQFRKFATLKEYQNKGFGTELLTFVFNQIKESNVKRIFCNARREKTNFYKKFGMEETKEIFIKGGREYIIMEKIIK